MNTPAKNVKPKSLTYTHEGLTTFEQLPVQQFDFETPGLDFVYGKPLLPCKITFTLTKTQAKTIFKELSSNFQEAGDTAKAKAIIALAKKAGLPLPSHWKH